MVTWMIHPKHGAHPAVGGEIEGLKANGWTVRPPKNAPVVSVDDSHIENLKAALTEDFPAFESPRQKRKYNRKAK